jgi:hypothetical protein
MMLGKSTTRRKTILTGHKDNLARIDWHCMYDPVIGLSTEPDCLETAKCMAYNIASYGM